MNSLSYKDYPFLALYSPGAKAVLAILIIWTLIWKGVALWKSARNGHKVWFIVLLLANTIGILDIIYIIWFSKKKPIVT